MSVKSRLDRIGRLGSTEMSKHRDSTNILVRRLTIGSAILVLLLGSWSLLAIRIQSNQVEKLNRSIDPVVDANNLVLANMNEEYSQFLQFQSLSEFSLPIDFADGRRRTIGALVVLEQKLQDLFGQTGGQATDAEGLEALQVDAVAQWQDFVQETEQGTIESNFSSALHGNELFDNFRQANFAIHQQIAIERARRLQLSEEFTTVRQFVVVGLTLLGVVAMFFIGFRFTRAISRPIAALRATMTRHRDGDSSEMAREDQGSAEIRSLATDFNALAEANLKSRLRIEDVNDRMANLIDLGNVLGEKLDLHDLLTRIVESARQLIGARYVAIGLLDESGKNLAQFVTAGFSPEQVAAIGDIPTGLGLLGATFHDSQVIRLEHISASPLSFGFPPNHPPMDSFLGVPIVIHGEVIGSFYLTESISGSFSAEDEQVAHSLSLLAAVAIKNVQRFEAERERVNVLERVKEIEHAILTKSASERRLDVMCASLGNGLAVDRVIVRTVDSGGGLQLASQWFRAGLQSIENLPSETFPFAGGVAELLWRTATIRIVEDCLAPSALGDEQAQAFNRITGARAAIFAPVGIADRVIGLISVLKVDAPRQWTATEIEVVKQIAEYVAKTVVDDEHQEYLRNYIEKLENLERQKSNFVATVSHELRTPLTSITGYLELLKDGYAGTINDEQQQMLDVMDRNSNRLRALIENLLVLNRYESIAADTKNVGVSIGELITKTCEEYFPLAQSRGITFEIELGSEAAIVNGAREQLQSAIGNIVSNAIKFSRPFGVITVMCVVDNDARMVRVSVQDRGIGIPAADQGNLFTRFFRAGNAIEKHIPGTGLGLSIVELIIRDHGGHIRLASAEGEGTTVVIDLPLAPGTESSSVPI